MIYYCFVKEDIKTEGDSPFLIELKYSSHLNNCIICDLSNRLVADMDGKEVSLLNIRVFLRCSIDCFERASALLCELGANLIESVSEYNTIEQWYKYCDTGRDIKTITVNELLTNATEDTLSGITISDNMLFLKTINKGFSLQLSTDVLTNDKKRLKKFFSDCAVSDDQELMLTSWHRLKTDSLGTIEARAFVVNGEIWNVSRNLHSVKHSVPKTLRTALEVEVKSLSKIIDFPHSFAIDMGLFLYGSEFVPDIIEINPISVSLCYINNSVFNTVSEDIMDLYLKTKWGPQYCFDALSNPERYSFVRDSNVTYNYKSYDRFALV